MIAFKHRFHGHGSLRFVYQNGKTVRGQLFAIKYVRNERRNTYRLAVVVSKKISKSAVVRNRIRRRLYEAFREVEDQIVQPYDVVVTVFSEQLKDVEYSDVQAAVKTQLHQAGVIS